MIFPPSTRTCSPRSPICTACRRAPSTCWDGELVERHSSAYIDISTKTDNPGIDIRIADGTKGETVYIPVIVTKSGLKDVVYNTFYVGENCDITIIAGCGITTTPTTPPRARHHPQLLSGKNSRVRYVEKHYGEGERHRRAHPEPPPPTCTWREGSSCRNGDNGAAARLHLHRARHQRRAGRERQSSYSPRKLLTHGNQTAISNMKVELKGARALPCR